MVYVAQLVVLANLTSVVGRRLHGCAERSVTFPFEVNKLTPEATVRVGARVCPLHLQDSLGGTQPGGRHQKGCADACRPALACVAVHEHWAVGCDELYASVELRP